MKARDKHVLLNNFMNENSNRYAKALVKLFYSQFVTREKERKGNRKFTDNLYLLSCKNIKRKSSDRNISKNQETWNIPVVRFVIR